MWSFFPPTILQRKAGASRSTILVFCVFRSRGGGECVGYPPTTL